ncbi:putative transglutaminase-like cysteine proteinase [Novosphingobium kunmingense]|uniref:Putative transglutaminase-like cysteine proteinase n=1 Tax=Novosphingobium kunmingense TaxID=1211806 RepID=A0A2N0H774_9SPHN|nr:transglutaminase-like cysteine peptidase [Novosphingobium kunmingense]PKB14777.1 putative transglutaminase-like cysteine proteinase [Novosphingobium kunmingense]
MSRNRTLVATALALSGLAVLAQPAAASLGVATLPMAVAASAFANSAACRAVIAPAAGVAPVTNVPVQSKAAAILGGAVSQLDLIRQQQAGALSAAPATLALVRTLEPAAGPAFAPLGQSNSCNTAGFAASMRPAVVAPAPALVPSVVQPVAPTSPDNFLASKRLAIRHTGFDKDWARVSGRGFSGSAVTRLIALDRGAPGLAELGAVNAWANARIRYVEDRELYGKADYWATAGETLRRRAGDCEDIAIAKMQLLAALGMPRDAMYLTIARDTVRASDHAVLVVRMGDKAWLLDNATDRVLDAEQSYDYRPIVSFSANKRWIHGY